GFGIGRRVVPGAALWAGWGGVLGALAGAWGVPALKALAPAGTPRLDDVGMDGRVLAFTAALSLVTGIVFGLVPALHAARDRFAGALKAGGRGQNGAPGGPCAARSSSPSWRSRSSCSSAEGCSCGPSSRSSASISGSIPIV